MSTAISGSTVAKKKQPSESPAKRYGTLIRVSDQLAEALRRVTHFEGKSVAEFADEHFLPIAEKYYQAAVLAEAKRIGGPKS